MADDLREPTPVSPAPGEDAPVGEPPAGEAPVQEPAAAASAAPEAPAAAPAAPPRDDDLRVHRYRFGLAYLALAVIAGAALGAAVLLVDRPATHTVAWSSWQPTGRPSGRANEIATFVSERYRLPSGKPLVGVLASPPQVQTREGPLALQAVAIQNDPQTRSDDISVVSTENGVMYTLCGLGERCSIKEGKPSVARARLLRREALELALYSFKYLDGVDSVIALLPTNLGDPADQTDDTSTAVFFRKSELKEELARPLNRTLLSAKPPLPSQISPIEGLTIDRLTESRLFRYQFTQTQSGGAVIVLDPVVG